MSTRNRNEAVNRRPGTSGRSISRRRLARNLRLEAALAYAQNGIPVIPLVRGEKRPLTQHGHHDATTDVETIREWWRNEPWANVGICTGRRSGIIVLDVDVKGDRCGDASLALLFEQHGVVETLIVRTPSGGRHLYFRVDQAVGNRVDFFDGLDIRADGGHVVAPPSIVEGSRYSWEGATTGFNFDAMSDAPQWLLEILDDRERQMQTEALDTETILNGVPEGQRDNALFRLACRFRTADMPRDAAERYISEAAANCSPPFPRQTALEKVERVYRLFRAGASEIVAELNQRHAVVILNGRVRILSERFDYSRGRHEIAFSTKHDFQLRYSNRKLGVGKKTISHGEIWLKHPERRQYADGISFAPGGAPPSVFNMFRGFPVRPSEGNCELYREHVRDVVCSGRDGVFEYLFNWMAHAIQRPAELPGVAIILRGAQGTGKGVFVEQFGKLFGEHFVTVYRLEHVVGRFNAHLRSALLVHANEAIWGGDKSSEGTLKGMITDPQSIVEYKGIDPVSVDNYKRLIVSSNESWASPVDIDDRRFVILNVSDCRKEDREYFAAIVDQMNNGGREALMHDLQNRDLSEFDVGIKPETGDGFDMKLRSMTPIQCWWFECLDRGHIGSCRGSESSDEWVQTLPSEEVYIAYCEWCQRRKERHIESDSVFGRELRKLVPDLRTSRPQIDADRVRCYMIPTLDWCRRVFERLAKSNESIWSDCPPGSARIRRRGG